MPPLDLGGGGEELKAACGCDTALSDNGSDAEERDDDDDDPYAPAQSLRLRIGEDIDWSDVGAGAVLERDDSTKGAGANPKCAARRSVAAAAAARSSLSSSTPPAPRAVAVVIGGLAPAAAGNAAREHGRRRRSPCRLGERARVFAAGEATADRLAEPGSPKVSCLGGVRSQPRAAAEGVGGGRRWWAWLAADSLPAAAGTAGARGGPGGAKPTSHWFGGGGATRHRLCWMRTWHRGLGSSDRSVE
ncbi:hypothetical protein C2845_PM12G15550 [Panicum miliaceum]|uniref:Uncharacterized protein n=1 Tax=Panicum miliaceum TaxID=4540 RepID=A0A3L6QCW9_PANMI|nr:hypothetical protein C2845_PM12G15550 [Panicum miliaceum]